MAVVSPEEQEECFGSDRKRKGKKKKKKKSWGALTLIKKCEKHQSGRDPTCLPSPHFWWQCGRAREREKERKGEKIPRMTLTANSALSCEMPTSNAPNLYRPSRVCGGAVAVFQEQKTKRRQSTTLSEASRQLPWEEFKLARKRALQHGLTLDPVNPSDPAFTLILHPIIHRIPFFP